MFDPDYPYVCTMNRTLDIRFTTERSDLVEATMPITEDVLQPVGLLHGGATITLLESCASRGAELLTDFEKERCFGIQANIRHWKSGKTGQILGQAKLKENSNGTQTWEVAAYDQEGDVISNGTFQTKIVTLERLAEKERKRQERKALLQAQVRSQA